MEKMIFKFLWKGPDKVTRLSVINTLDNGGLNLTDFESHIKALRLSWIPRLLDEREGPWKSYLKYKFKKYGGCFLFRCNYDVKDLDWSSFCGGRNLEVLSLMLIIPKMLSGIIRTSE